MNAGGRGDLPLTPSPSPARGEGSVVTKMADSHFRNIRQELIASARTPDDLSTLVFAGVIARAASRAAPYDVAIAGLSRESLARLLAEWFPDAERPLAALPPGPCDFDARADEFADLLALLLEHASFPGEETAWLAHAVATASMGENHLWQDMGLPHRKALSVLMQQYFTPLARKNVGDMKWKKFFYRQLCERAEVLICKSPSCGICIDYHVCFETAEAAATP